MQKYAKIAQLACSSTYDFQRMFSFVIGISIVEYIRRRRLTLSAFELQESDIKVVDLAIKYGYESPVSFSRAFKSMHGITPAEARNSNVELKAFSRISFQIIIKGVNEMNYRIIKRLTIQLTHICNVVLLPMKLTLMDIPYLKYQLLLGQFSLLMFPIGMLEK